MADQLEIKIEKGEVQDDLYHCNAIFGFFPKDGPIEQGSHQLTIPLEALKDLVLAQDHDQYGQVLGDCLFCGTLERALRKQMDRKSTGHPPVLSLNLGPDPTLTGLRWEYLMFKLDDQWEHLALSQRVAFSMRPLETERTDGYAAPEVAKLKALVVVASPRQYDTINTPEVVECLALGLKSVAAHFLCPDEARENLGPGHLWLGKPTIDAFKAALIKDQYQIVHLLCHGSPNYLVFEDEDGNKSFLSEKNLIDWFRQISPPPSLVFLAACHSGQPSNGHQLGNLGYQLAQLGVPAVIAMRDQVLVSIAQELAVAFYPRLLVTGSATQALSQARNLVPGEKSQLSIPMLYSTIPHQLLFVPRDHRQIPRGKRGVIGGLLFGLLLALATIYFFYDKARASADAEMAAILKEHNDDDRPMSALQQGVSRGLATPALRREMTRALSRFPEVEALAISADPIAVGFGGPDEVWAVTNAEWISGIPGTPSSTKTRECSAVCAVGNDAFTAVAERDYLRLSVGKELKKVNLPGIALLKADQERLLIADSAGSIYTLELSDTTPKLLANTGHDVVGLGFRAKGAVVAIVDSDGRLACLDLTSGTQRDLGSHGGIASCQVGREALTFRPRQEPSLYWLGADPAALPQRLDQAPIQDWAMDRTGNLVVACDDEGQIHLWRQGTHAWAVPLDHRIDHVRISGDGRLIAASGEKNLDLLEGLTGERLASWSWGTQITGLELDETGAQLLTATATGKLLRWQTRPPQRINPDQDWRPLRSLKGGSLLLGVTEEQTVCWDLLNHRPWARTQREYLHATQSRDGALLLTIDGPGSACLWRLQGQPAAVRVTLPDADATSLPVAAFDAQGASVAISQGQRLYLLDTKTCQTRRVWQAPREVRAICYDASARRWHVADSQGQIYSGLHDGSGFQKLGQPKFLVDWLFAPDHAEGLVAVSRSGAVSWLSREGKPMRERNLGEPLQHCALIADHVIAFQGSQGSIWLWDGTKHEDPVKLPETWLTFAWGRTTLVLAQHQRVALMDLDELRIFAEYEDPRAQYQLVDIDPNDQYVVAVDARGLVRHWRLEAPAGLLSQAKHLLATLGGPE